MIAARAPLLQWNTCRRPALGPMAWVPLQAHRPFVIGAPGAQPGANFLAGQVAAGFLVGRPGCQGFLLEALAGFEDMARAGHRSNPQ